MRIPYLLLLVSYSSSFKGCPYANVSWKSNCLINKELHLKTVPSRWVSSKSPIRTTRFCGMAEYENDANDSDTGDDGSPAGGVEGFVLERASVEDLTDSMWLDLEESQPSEWVIMNDVST